MNTHEQKPDSTIRKPELDPIEWAIIGIIISGSSLLLTIQGKLRERRRDAREEIAREARSGNILRISTIKGHIKELADVISQIQEIGHIIENESDHPLGKFSFEFETPSAHERYNQLIDRATSAIARINRLVGQIDIRGFPISDEDYRQYVEPLFLELKQITETAIQIDSDPKKRFDALKYLLDRYINLCDRIESLM
jgi:hypothetical protein